MATPTQIQVRRDTSANWLLSNPVLAKGEPGFESDTGRLIIGDGVSQYSALRSVSAPVAAKNPFITMGDSRNALGNTPVSNYNTNGYVVTTNAVMNGRMDYRANFAVTGQTSGHMLTVQLPQALAYAATNPVQYAFIDVGHNDITGVAGGSTDPNGILSNVQAVVSALFARGIRTILSTSGTSTVIGASTTLLANLKKLNNLYKNVASNFPGVLAVIDVFGCVVNVGTGSFDPNYYLSDNIHYNYQGSQRIAAYASQILSPIIPSTPALNYDVFNGDQFANNPRLFSTTALPGNTAGTNGWVLGSGGTGTGPDNFTGGKSGSDLSFGSGTATGTFSVVARTDNRAGTLVNVAHTGGAAYEATRLSSPQFSLISWSSGIAVTVSSRIRPTVFTGVQYRVVTAGSLATGADPTAGWSTVIGTRFTSGSATLEAVPSIEIGDTVQLVAEVFASGFNGAAAIMTQLQQLQSNLANIGSVYGSYADQTSPLPTTVPTYQIIRSAPMVLAANMGVLQASVVCRSNAGVTGTWQLGACEIQKYV